MSKKLFWWCFKACLLIFTISSFVTAYLIFYYTRDLPDYSELTKYYPALVTRVYTADGKLIEEYAKEHRIFVPISAVPRRLIEAFIAAEDKNFYNHPGIDISSIVRVGITNIGKIINHQRLQGASTITQQVVKNFLVGSERSFGRKIREAVLSYMISKVLNKEQILELYLNQTFFGKNSYGVAAAAQNYFNKSVEELSLPEAAFIAGLPKAPSTYNSEKNYSRAKERRDYVIARMLEDKYITREEARIAIETPIVLVKRDPLSTVTAGFFAEHVRNLVIEMYGEEEFYTGGLNIFTTLDTQLQVEAERSLVAGIRDFDCTRGYRKILTNIDVNNWEQNLLAIEEPANIKEFKLAVVLNVTDNQAQIGLKDGSKNFILLKEIKWARTNLKSVKALLKKGDVILVEPIGKNFALRQIPEVNGAILVMDPHDGKVLAHVGGYDYNVTKFDRVTQAQRQPGSLIKTFVYLAALEQDIPPNTIYNDSPIELSQGPGMPIWRPKNYKGDFLGPITMRAGLEKSRNLVTVRIAQHIGIAKIVEIINRYGISSKLPFYYSVVLGALETTLEKMTNAYAMIANGGILLTPQYIEMIQDRNGKIIYRRDDRRCDNCRLPLAQEHMTLPQVADRPARHVTDGASGYQIISLLRGAVERGTGSRLNKLGKIIANKTGTTNNSYDAWDIAFTNDLVVGTYIGYDIPRTLGSRATGTNVALPIVERFLATALLNQAPVPFMVPPSIQLITIDSKTGHPSSAPNAIIEAFKIGNSTSDHLPMKYNNEEIDLQDMFDKYLPQERRQEFLDNIGEVY